METRNSPNLLHTVTALLQYYLLKWDTFELQEVSQKLLSLDISVSDQRQLL